MKEYSESQFKSLQAKGLLKGTEPDFVLKRGDILKEDWSDAAFVFSNSTCFSEDLMESLSLKAQKLKKGAFFVTFTEDLPQCLNSDKWEVSKGFKRFMSWGLATVYIHHKIK